VHQATIVHSYPFCERTDTPLIYRAIEAWYVKVEDLHDQLVTNNGSVHWMPAAIGEKRFGNWLRKAKDWNISRNRFWGSCIPVWVAEGDKDDRSASAPSRSWRRLSGRTRHRPAQAHPSTPSRSRSDAANLPPHARGARLLVRERRDALRAGPLPVREQGAFRGTFPADFIAEGLDQTRGWFYTLMVLSTALFKKPAFKNVVVNGLVLAEDGRKMSKRLKNYPDPNADSRDLRRGCAAPVHDQFARSCGPMTCASPADGVKQVPADLLIPWWNAYSFFVTYANIDGWEPVRRGGTRLAAPPRPLDPQRAQAL
jgi:isoleucyl-tRNA synthetase